MIGFGKFGKKHADAMTITALTDPRLVAINPQEDGFFDAVIDFKSDSECINEFIEAIKEVKAEKLEFFYKPIYCPSEDGDKIVYKDGKKPAAFQSYNWWCQAVSKMPAVEGKQWKLATEYQYYTFLVWVINQLVKSGKSVEHAINHVVCDAKEKKHCEELVNSTEVIVGVKDLLLEKFLRCSSKAEGFWIGGGFACSFGLTDPLAELSYLDDTQVDREIGWTVGMLVL